MVREALAYIKVTFISTTVMQHKDRAEADRVSTYPFEAIEEALSAAAHLAGRPRPLVSLCLGSTHIIALSSWGGGRLWRREEWPALPERLAARSGRGFPES